MSQTTSNINLDQDEAAPESSIEDLISEMMPELNKTVQEVIGTRKTMMALVPEAAKILSDALNADDKSYADIEDGTAVPDWYTRMRAAELILYGAGLGSLPSSS